MAVCRDGTTCVRGTVDRRSVVGEAAVRRPARHEPVVRGGGGSSTRR